LIKTNIGAYLLLSGFFLEQMAGYGIEGDIINIGSMSADTRDGNSSGYVATKSAIQGFTEALRKEANPHNIRVSLVEPGAVGTDMQSSSPQEQRVLQDKREMLHAEDIARAILFILAQDRRVSVSEIQIKPLRQFI
jgi:NADP-dependent 3-hydroxy acid dehydrogenase YdfG